jgi:hypothetical protein
MGPPPASFPEEGLHNGFPSGIDCFGHVQDETGVAAAGDCLFVSYFYCLYHLLSSHTAPNSTLLDPQSRIATNGSAVAVLVAFPRVGR